MNKKKKAAMSAGLKDKPVVREGKTLNLWISTDLRDALDRVVERAEPRATLKGHVELALKRYLKELGEWPPQEQ